jgi:hypothetical protein
MALLLEDKGFLVAVHRLQKWNKEGITATSKPEIFT